MKLGSLTFSLISVLILLATPKAITAPIPNQPQIDTNKSVNINKQKEPANPNNFQVTEVPKDLAIKLDLSPFYKKYCDANGIPILASDQVSDYALKEAAFLIIQMIGHRQDLIDAIANNKIRVVIMAPNEFTTDIPEHSDLTPKEYWDRRARGLGATPHRPAISCAEENLLSYPGDPYASENIFIHEFAHVIHQIALKDVDPTFDKRLRQAYANAIKNGLWSNTYAGSNPEEYWAEGTQSYFNCNRQNDSEHNDINSKAKLKNYDPQLTKLLSEVFGDNPWQYEKPFVRNPASPHLAGFDTNKMKTFKWPDKLLNLDQSSFKNEISIPTNSVTLTPINRNLPNFNKSFSSSKATKLFFKNLTDSTVQIYWLDFSGNAHLYTPIKPGDTWEVTSYANHIWSVRSQDNKEISRFICEDKPCLAIIKQN